MAAIISVFWAAHLLFPLHQLQHLRWIFFGHAVPVYYFFTALPILILAAYSLWRKRNWTSSEILWWALPLVCLPGIAWSADRAWSARQCLSFIVRGGMVGGVFLLAADGRSFPIRILRWIYPVALAAAFVGLAETAFDKNPISDSFWDRSVPNTAGKENPFYRPAWVDYSVSERPRGTQGNRIAYAAILVPWIPIGLWRLKHGRRRLRESLFLAALGAMILLAHSRADWLGLSVALSSGIALLYGANRRALLHVAASAVLLALIFLAWSAMHADPAWLRFADVRAQHRLASWGALHALQGHWLWGRGYGRYPDVFKPYYHGPLPWIATPDNQYLRWLIENGVLGLAGLLAFLAALIRAGWKRIRAMSDGRTADFYKALLAGWAGIAATFFFFDGFYWGACDMTFWSLLGLFAACLKYP